MSIVSKEELIKRVTEKFGNELDDDTISLVEDISDTLDDFENKASDTTDWKEKYETNDKEWREKYVARFNEGGASSEETNEENIEPPKNLTYENLFEEKE